MDVSPTPSPVATPRNGASPLSHNQTLDHEVSFHRYFSMGAHGLARSFSNMSKWQESFVSMWLASLILHVHPKKQHWLIMQDINGRRAMLMQKQRDTLFSRPVLFSSKTGCPNTGQCELQTIYGAWKDQCLFTRHLALAYDRVEVKAKDSSMRGAMKDWMRFVEMQEMKRKTITRIVQRGQERRELKVLNLWFQVTGSLAILNHLTKQGRNRHLHAVKSWGFQSWQAIRQKALKAIAMMDRSNSKWNRELVSYVLREWAESIRSKKLRKSRSLFLIHKQNFAVKKKAIVFWSQESHAKKRLNMIHIIIRWKAGRTLVKQIFKRLRSNADEERERFSRYRKIVARQVVQDQKSAFRNWQLHYNDLKSRAFQQWSLTAKVLHFQILSYNRMIQRRNNAMVSQVFDDWVQSHSHNVVRANKLMGLMSRWDQRTLFHAFQACGAFTGWSKKVRDVISMGTERRSNERGRLALSLWSSYSSNQRRLFTHARQLAARVTARKTIRLFAVWHKFARESKKLEVSLSRAQLRHEKRMLLACFQVWVEITSDTSVKALAISRKDAKYLYQLSQSMFQYWCFVTEEVKSNLKKNAKAYSYFEQNSYFKFFERWLQSYHWYIKIKHLKLRVQSSRIFHVTDDHFSEWLNITLRKRALAIHQSAVAKKNKKALFQDSFQTWFAEKCRLRKCRNGLINLSERMMTNSKKFHFDEWTLDTSMIARHSRLSAIRFEKYCEGIVSDVFDEWKAVMRCIVAQSKGVERISARYAHKVLRAFLVSWTLFVDDSSSDKSKVSKCDRKRLFRSCRNVLIGWMEQARCLRVNWQKCIAMSNRLERKRLRSNFVIWSEYTRQTIDQVQSIEKFILRQSNGMFNLYMQEWFDAVNTWKQLRSKVALYQRRADAGRKHKVLLLLWSLVVDSRNVRKVEERRKRGALSLAASSWGQTARSLEHCRKGVEKMILRHERRLFLCCFDGWRDELAYLKSAYSRAQTVQTRTMTTRAGQAVRQLVDHARKQRRHRRMLVTHSRRWYLIRLKNSFESWHHWHGKKMAVKGVLDQVVDMM
ncbi:hypothetical protein GUITHDRAFT_114566 [Guillardia theta CCMP2712]|uniref:Sfi1 spindle body domain-containing protein n=1 Tax=Guillardia theta (strain CCMP2712) TaxID=905079 RepID=L1IU12_GUITC|nr:hypothetical protein GUITHDRAFT_114566 [Guillardia theta CCMP2712]EKX39369.1 hypothetical protein GUITHDRAFT_114566 [Guillardia theta CCMP2712]|eukprot:XP_005826349.1 hypothetical protein GUITHDRAFT_114566 [Guillardia theta CCMP2712]